MTKQISQNMPKPPKPLQILILLASAAAGLGAAACLYLAIFQATQVLWASAGFMIVILVAAALGILTGTGRFRIGYGMAALSIAGTIAGGALFGWRDLASNLGRDPQIGPMLLPWLGFEAACGLVIAFAGALAVLSRVTTSWRYLNRGLLLLIPAAVLLGAGYFGWNRLPDESSGRVIGFGLLLIGGLVIGTLVSLGGHNVIRAFEVAGEDPNIPQP